MKQLSTFFSRLNITFLFLLSCNLVFAQRIWKTKSIPVEGVLHDIFSLIKTMGGHVVKTQ